MAGISRVAAVLRGLGLISWRHARALGSIAGQNIFIFIVFVALQPESAAFFLLLLLMVLLFPLSTDPMEQIPAERRGTWPLADWEWRGVRLVSVLLSPVSWVGFVLLVKAGWRAAVIVLGLGACLLLAKHFGKQWGFSGAGRWRVPAAPGVVGGIARLQWRSMWHTLDPYLALVLMAGAVLYRVFGKAVDPAAWRIMALVVVLAVSTLAQVLFGMDGRGAERYRQWPVRGWQILLGKDLAFLLLVAVLVTPLDFLGGFFGGMAALAVGHHASVMKPVAQGRWRFTAGVLWPHGGLQTVALFAVGNVARTNAALVVPVCLAGWAVSLAVYGWVWDRGHRSRWNGWPQETLRARARPDSFRISNN